MTFSDRYLLKMLNFLLRHAKKHSPGRQVEWNFKRLQIGQQLFYTPVITLTRLHHLKDKITTRAMNRTGDGIQTRIKATESRQNNG